MIIVRLFEWLIFIAGVVLVWKFILKPITLVLKRVRDSLPTRPASANDRLEESRRDLEDAQVRLQAAKTDHQVVKTQREIDKVYDETLREVDSSGDLL